MLIHRNLKTQNLNPVYNFIVGLMFGGMTAWVVIEGDKKPKGIDQLDWIYIFIFSLLAVWFIIKGLRGIFSKAYILVDDEKVSVKPDESTKSETIYWRDVESIKEVKNNYVVRKKDNTTTTIYFSYFSQKHAMDLKASVKETALKKGIPLEEQKSKYLLGDDD